jgi:subtilisin family serine protease/putative cell wall-binding protein
MSFARPPFPRAILLAAVLCLTLIVAPLNSGLSSAGSGAGSTAGDQPIEAIVTMVANADPHQVLADYPGVEISHVLTMAVNAAVITAPTSTVDLLAVHPQVTGVEISQPLRMQVESAVTAQPTWILPASLQQNSPPSWGLDRIDQRNLPLDGVFRYPVTANGVRIYVVDSGVYAGHSDLNGRVLPGFSSYGGNTNDCKGHGTHVAATAAGTTFGVAKAAVIVPVRVFDASDANCEQTSSANVTAGMEWILQQHAVGGPAQGQVAVVNLSIGGASQNASTVLEEHVKAMVRAGLIVVAAAGNVDDTGVLDACQVSPAKMPEVLTVAASTQSDQLASFSRRGTCVDLLAPGDAIRSAWIGSVSASQVVSGTSMATPHVAGILAQLIALNPSATGASVRSAAESMATTGVLGGLDGGSPNRLAYLNPNLTVTESLNVGLTSGSTPFVVTHSVAEGTARVSFERVTTAGTLSISQAQSAPATGMTGAQLVTGHYEITASGVQFARAEVCLPYRPADLSAVGRSANELRLIRFTGSSGRTDITSRIVTASNQVCGFTTSFSPFGIGYYNTSRIQGADRYVTASQIAQREYAGPVPVVYLASGERFPDALAAAPAAVAEGGPVLLTRAGELPTSTREQLQRLAPSRVVIVGGTGAISAAVASAVQTAVPSATVTRRFGDTRYETAAAVSANLFTPGVSRVYVATGLSAPDALAAASAAGGFGAPVLLVPGSGPNAGVPTAVATELARLQPTQIIVMGGTAAVSGAVFNQIAAAAPGASISRVAGATRYETAAKLAAPCASGRLFVATGAQFADALAGATVAGRSGCPMLLVPPTGWDAAIDTALSALGSTTVTILGGPAAVPYTVESRLAFRFPF